MEIDKLGLGLRNVDGMVFRGRIRNPLLEPEMVRSTTLLLEIMGT
jgi:hypothetical protein